MAEFPDMVFSPVAYLADCGHLSDAEHGRYFLMLQHMWLAPSRRFPNDDQWLARKFRRSEAEVREQLRPLLAEFFQTDGNWLRHKRLDRDWERLAKTRAKQSARAKCRWNKDNDTSHGNADAAMHSGIATLHVPANPLESLGQTGDSHGTSNLKVLSPLPPVPPLSPQPPIPPLSPQPSISKDSTEDAQAREVFEAEFREWYSGYPRKVGSQRAASAYRTARKRASHEEIMDGLRRAILAWERKGTPAEYIPHPATWLNGGRWADDDFVAGNGTADPIGEADRMSKTLIRKMHGNDHEQEFAGTHSLVPDGPPPGVWSWPEDDAGASDLAERAVYRSLVGPVAGNA